MVYNCFIFKYMANIGSYFKITILLSSNFITFSGYLLSFTFAC
nr:MAG TPA_asm: hypothetical protein [Caudoviricetes sp.]